MRATASKTSSLDQLESARVEKYVDMRVVFRRRKTGENLPNGEFGGRWDRAEEEYVNDGTRRGKVFWLNEAQSLGLPGNEVEDGPIAQLVEWMQARAEERPRVIELVFDGARGSGKSHLGVLAVFAIAVAFPGARCLLISPANTRIDELEIIVKACIPLAWRRIWSERKMTYYLPNGSTIRYIGADDEDALKQGGFEVALMNEAQLMTSTAYAHGIAGVRNVEGRPAGLLILAMNYASKERGEWTNDHLDNIEAGLLNAKHVKLDPELNENVQGGVLSDIEIAIRSVRPDLADIDSLGLRKRLGIMAAPAFKPYPMEKGGHVGEPPARIVSIHGVEDPKNWKDVTREITRRLLGGNGFLRCLSADFQRRPGCVGAVGRLMQKPDGLIMFIVDAEIVAVDNEDDLGAKFKQYLADIGLTVDDAFIIADSTGSFQNGRHDRSDKHSHEILREWGFKVVGCGRINRDGTMGLRNPDVDDSLAQFYDICRADRILVSSRCPTIIDALRRGKVRRSAGRISLDPTDGHSHYVDLIRYFTWYVEPRRGPTAPRSTTDTADRVRRIRVLTSG